MPTSADTQIVLTLITHLYTKSDLPIYGGCFLLLFTSFPFTESFIPENKAINVKEINKTMTSKEPPHDFKHHQHLLTCNAIRSI